MSEAAHSRAREASFRQDIVLAPPEIEPFPGEGREIDARRARQVAAERLAWENRRFIFRSTVWGTLVSVLLVFLIPQRFESTTRLMPPDQGSSGMGLAMLAAAGGNLGSQLGSGLGSVAGDLLGLKSSSDLFIGILQSRTVQDDVIHAFQLQKVYSDRRIEDAREDLTKRTDLSVDRKSGILTIQVTDTNPQRAAAMAGEYAAELDRVVTQLNTSSAHRERVFLEERLTQVKKDLESTEKNFSEFATRNTALDIPTQARAMIEAAATLEGQLIAAQTELEGLKQVYTDSNVRVRTTEARVRELRDELQKNMSGASRGATAASEPQTPSPFPSLRELPALGVSYADLYRNTKIQEAVYQTLTQEFELAKVQEAKETPSVKILDPPDVPQKRSFPPRALIIMLGATLAFSGSMTLIFGKRAWEKTEPEDPQKAFAREVLQTVRASLPWPSANGSGAVAANGHQGNPFPENPESSDRDS